jgi:acetone carboxylase gamma subunit
VFEGRPLVDVTEYERDDEGRVIRAVTTRESPWNDQDREELLALMEHEASLCPCGCGHSYADTTSNWETGPEFEVTRKTCRARAAINLEQRIAQDKKADTSADLWGSVIKRG